jgi:dTDP-4-amino-4,6-dideoxygalactose transaminase
MYRALLAGVEDVTPVSVPPSSQPVYHQFVIRTEDRDALRQALEKRGIQTGIHYPLPLHRQPAFAQYVSRADAAALPETDAAAASILSLPMYPELRDRDVDDIGGAIAQSLERADVVA